MSYHRFSRHPIYRNAPWPNSYLIHPLSIIPVELTCLVAYTNDPPLRDQTPTYPLDRFDWIKPNPDLTIDLWSSNILALRSNKTMVEFPSKPSDIPPAKRLAIADCTRVQRDPCRRPLPIPTIRPAITCKKAHAKLASALTTMKQIQQTAQVEASNIVSDILENRAKELTIKSVNNPMIIRHTPSSIAMTTRVSPSVAEPAFSTR